MSRWTIRILPVNGAVLGLVRPHLLVLFDPYALCDDDTPRPSLMSWEPKGPKVESSKAKKDEAAIFAWLLFPSFLPSFLRPRSTDPR